MSGHSRGHRSSGKKKARRRATRQALLKILRSITSGGPSRGRNRRAISDSRRPVSPPRRPTCRETSSGASGRGRANAGERTRSHPMRATGREGVGRARARGTDNKNHGAGAPHIFEKTERALWGRRTEWLGCSIGRGVIRSTAGKGEEDERARASARGRGGATTSRTVEKVFESPRPVNGVGSQSLEAKGCPCSRRGTMVPIHGAGGR